MPTPAEIAKQRLLKTKQPTVTPTPTPASTPLTGSPVEIAKARLLQGAGSPIAAPEPPEAQETPAPIPGRTPLQQRKLEADLTRAHSGRRSAEMIWKATESMRLEREQGLDKVAAAAQAAANYEQMFQRPTEPDRKYGINPIADVVSRALTTDQPTNVEPVGDVSPYAAAFGRQEMVVDPSRYEAERNLQINWQEFRNDLGAKNPDAPEAQLIQYTAAYKAAYGMVRNRRPDASVEEVMAEVDRAFESMAFKDAGFGPQLRGKETEGDTPFEQATSLQRRAGGVPDYTPVEMVIKQTLNNLTRQTIIEAKREEARTVEVDTFKLEDGSEIDVTDYDMDAYGPIAGRSKRKLSDEEVERYALQAADKEQPDEWWTDPNMKPLVLADPGKYANRGIFESETPFRGTVEAGGGYAIRMITSPLNAIAGALTDATGSPGAQVIAGDELDMTEEKRKLRKEKKPIFEDSPVLYNVAGGLGFGGESLESYEILKREDVGTENQRQLLVVGGVLLDFMDPSVAAGGGVLKGARVAKQAGRAQRVVGAVAKSEEIVEATSIAGKVVQGVGDIKRGARTGAQAGAASFIEDATVFGIGQKYANKLKPGDPRLAALNKVTAERQAAVTVMKAAEEGKSIPEVREILKRDFPQTEVAKQVDSAASLQTVAKSKDIVKTAGVKASDIRTFARNKILDATTIPKIERMRALRAVIETESEVADAVKAMDVPRTEENLLMALDEAEALDKYAAQLNIDIDTARVLEATKDMAVFDDYVMVTRQTAVRAEDAAKIQKFVREQTDAGKFAAGLVQEKTPIVAINTDRGVELAYDLGVGDTALKRQWQQLNEMTSDLWAKAPVNVRSAPDGKLVLTEKIPRDPPRYVPTRAVREAQEIAIDSAARGKRLQRGDARTLGVIGDPESARIGATRRKEFLTPMETRSFGRSVWNDIKQKYMPWTEKATEGLTIREETILRDAAAKIDSLDTTLRTSMFRARQSPEFARAIGIEDASQLSDTEILGYLTVGNRSEYSISSTLGHMAKNHVRLQKKGGGVTGLSTDGFTTDLYPDQFLNVKGKERLQQDTDAVAARIKADPSTYLDEVDNMLEYWTKFMKSDDATPYLKPEFAGTHKVVALDDKKALDNLLVNAYYTSQVKRIKRAAMEDMFGQKAESFSASYLANVPASQRPQLLEEFRVNIYGDDPTEFFSDMVMDRVTRNMAGEHLIWDVDKVKAFDKAAEDIYFTKQVEIEDPYTPTPDSAQFDLDYARDMQELLEFPDEVKIDFMNHVDRAAGSVVDSNRVEFRALLKSTEDMAKEVDDIDILADKYLKAIEDMYGIGDTAVEGSSDALRLALGPAQAERLSAMTNSVGYRNLENAIKRDLYVANSPKAVRAAYNAGLWLAKVVKDIFYTSILGVRTRFPGQNIASAPFIQKSTIGRTYAENSVLAAATQQAGPSRNPFTNNTWMDTAYVDPAGRHYTHGEIYDAVIAGGGTKSATGFEISDSVLADASKIVKPRYRGKVRNAWGKTQDWLQQGNEAADSFFRLNVAHGALKEGRSMTEAVALARESMFDYRNMSAIERNWVQKFTVFYPFFRQNMAALANNIMSPKGWQRIYFGIKSERGMEQIAEAYGGVPMSDVFMKAYVDDRPVVGVEQRGQKRMASMLPGIPMNMAIRNVNSIVTTPVEFATGFAHPWIAAAMDNAKIKTTTSKLQPHHVIMLSPGSPQWQTMEYLIGPVRGTPGTPEEGAVNGLVYNLTPSQEAWYKNYVRYAEQPMGYGTALADAAATYGELAGYEKPGVESGLQKFMFVTGLYTPALMKSPEAVEAESIKSLTQEATGQTADLKPKFRY